MFNLPDLAVLSFNIYTNSFVFYSSGFILQYKTQRKPLNRI